MFDYQKFFRDYGAAFAQPEQLSSFYGDCAMASAPAFVGCLKGKAEILKAMKASAAFQEKSGLLSMEPARVETKALDPFHRMAKVQWKLKYLSAGEISFAASYLLREEPHKVVILLYLAHEDEDRLRKEIGLT